MFRTTSTPATKMPPGDLDGKTIPGVARENPDARERLEDVLLSPETHIAGDRDRDQPTRPANETNGAVLDPQRPIGQILVMAGRLTSKNAQRILQVATRYSVRFGEAGLSLGLLQPDDLDFALAQQFSFPYIPRGDTSMSRDLLAAYAPEHALVEQLRGLRNQILMRANSGKNGAVARPQPVVSVVSVSRGDGRSFIAANLAAVFAQQGERTLLIDADMRNPKQDALFKLTNRAGLSTMLAGRSGIETVHRIRALGRLYVLTAGPTPPNPTELLGRELFTQMLDSAAANFKAVIIDTPASDGSADAQVISSRAGSSILVARSNRTKLAQAKRFAQDLADSRANVLGLVYNDRP